MFEINSSPIRVRDMFDRKTILIYSSSLNIIFFLNFAFHHSHLLQFYTFTEKNAQYYDSLFDITSNIFQILKSGIEGEFMIIVNYKL